MFLPFLLVLSSIVPEVREAIAVGRFADGQRMIAEYQKRVGADAEMVEALSWMARSAAARKQWAEAERLAAETYKLSNVLLQKRGRLDAEPHLPIALGAAIEVQGQAMAARGERDQAVAYLQNQVKLYYPTSIRMRIQKNLNMLSMEGKPMPALSFGSLPPVATKGKVVALFFWAHWCTDCRAEAPIIERLKREYGPKGVVFIAPTQHYGYVGGGEDASPAVEEKYIAEVRKVFYAGLADVAMPINEENFKRFGCSTTPTVVMADRSGIVRLYHPGAMTEPELRARLDLLVK